MLTPTIQEMIKKMWLNYHTLIWFFIFGMYAPVFVQLYQSRWEAIDYTHAYFVLPVSLWMIWTKRSQLLTSVMEFQPRGHDVPSFLSFTFGLFLFVFGWRQEFLIVSTFSMIPLFWGAVRFLYGPVTAKTATFPILYLIFLVPPPLGILDKITLPLRYMISDAAAVILHALNYPITKNGLMLTMGPHEIFMGAPCSGFRSLITMLALTVAYVYFIKGSARKKVILTLAGVPFALFGNLVRVMGLCLMTFYAGPEAAEGFFHDFSGGFIFLLMIVLLMALEHFLNRFKAL